MNILMISDVYFPRINGVSTSIQTFMSEFVQLDHQVSFIAPAYNGEKEETDIYRIPSRAIPYDQFRQQGDNGKSKTEFRPDTHTYPFYSALRRRETGQVTGYSVYCNLPYTL